jgi:hypothetical protein
MPAVLNGSPLSAANHANDPYEEPRRNSPGRGHVCPFPQPPPTLPRTAPACVRLRQIRIPPHWSIGTHSRSRLVLPLFPGQPAYLRVVRAHRRSGKPSADRSVSLTNRSFILDAVKCSEWQRPRRRGSVAHPRSRWNVVTLAGKAGTRRRDVARRRCAERHHEVALRILDGKSPPSPIPGAAASVFDRHGAIDPSGSARLNPHVSEPATAPKRKRATRSHRRITKSC